MEGGKSTKGKRMNRSDFGIVGVGGIAILLTGANLSLGASINPTSLISVPVTEIQQPRVHAAEESCGPPAFEKCSMPGTFLRSLPGLQTQAGWISVTSTEMREVEGLPAGACPRGGGILLPTGF